jgi:hypothetical protein
MDSLFDNYSLSLYELFESHLSQISLSVLSLPMPTPGYHPLTCDHEFQGVTWLNPDRAGPVRVVATAVTPYASTRYVGDQKCSLITGGSPELH